MCSSELLLLDIQVSPSFLSRCLQDVRIHHLPNSPIFHLLDLFQFWPYVEQKHHWRNYRYRCTKAFPILACLSPTQRRIWSPFFSESLRLQSGQIAFWFPRICVGLQAISSGRHPWWSRNSWESLKSTQIKQPGLTRRGWHLWYEKTTLLVSRQS